MLVKVTKTYEKVQEGTLGEVQSQQQIGNVTLYTIYFGDTPEGKKMIAVVDKRYTQQIGGIK